MPFELDLTIEFRNFSDFFIKTYTTRNRLLNDGVSRNAREQQQEGNRGFEHGEFFSADQGS